MEIGLDYPGGVKVIIRMDIRGAYLRQMRFEDGALLALKAKAGTTNQGIGEARRRGKDIGSSLADLRQSCQYIDLSPVRLLNRNVLYARTSVVTRQGSNRDLMHKDMKKSFPWSFFFFFYIWIFFFCFLKIVTN